MDPKHAIQALSDDFARIRQALQEGRRLTPDEYHLVKVMIDSLAFDLDRNQKKEDQPSAPTHRRSA